MTPYLSDPDVTLYAGDALEVLRELPAHNHTHRRSGLGSRRFASGVEGRSQGLAPMSLPAVRGDA